MTWGWDRLGPVSGLAAVLGWVLSIFVIEGVGDSPGDNATAANVLRYFETEEGSLYVGGVLFFIASALLIWFGSSLRAAIGERGGTDRIASIVFGSAVATAVLSMAFVAPQVGGAFAANESEAPLLPGAAQALWFAGDGFFVATEFAAASLLVATAVAIFATRVLPLWLAWLGLVIAVLLVIPPIGWAGLIFGFPLWVLITSVLLWRQAEPAAAVTRETTTDTTAIP
jgi:hypothetical protein